MGKDIESYSAAGYCRECDEGWTDVDARMKAIQHYKATGHETRVRVEQVEVFASEHMAVSAR